MHCLLINSPIYRERSEAEETYLPPLGLGYIATQLKESGVDVEIVDCVKSRYGVEEIRSLLKEKNPEYIGLNIFTQNYDIVRSIVENCPILGTIFIGGQVVKSIYEEIIQWNVNNKLILIIGEGELILPSIILGNCEESPFFSKTNKFVYSVNQNSKYYPYDLSAIHLDRSFLQNEIITNHYGQQEVAIIASRGCIYNCAFCGGARELNHDVSVRRRKSQDIVNEINEIIDLYPEVSSIRVLDDLFLRNEETITDAIAIFNGFNNLYWRGMAHVLSFEKSLYLLNSLKSSGCRELFIGIESGSDRIRKYINKAGTVDQIITVVSAILTAGINVKGYFIYGFPRETQDDCQATYKLAMDLKNISSQTQGIFRSSVFQFRPYHGTRLYRDIISSGQTINSIVSNPSINSMQSRSQFNFQSGNYCEVSDNKLNNYILRTQQLSEEAL
ncbi:MAG: radical SAM protein [Oscillospiraceae bacterium]|nr:radical SAM protein [Oscillospiraceae bacterium]